MEPFTFLILALVTWRLSHMVSSEAGPGDLFARFREWLGARYDAGRDREVGMTFWSRLIVCPLCLSVWVAPVVMISWGLGPVSQWVILALAISGVSSILTLGVKR